MREVVNAVAAVLEDYEKPIPVTDIAQRTCYAYEAALAILHYNSAVPFARFLRRSWRIEQLEGTPAGSRLHQLVWEEPR